MVWLDEWLERLSWVALVTLPFLFILAGYLFLRRIRPFEEDLGEALRAASTSQLIDILRLVEEQDQGDARATVLMDIAARERREEDWWENDEHLHRGAASISVSYDRLAGVINFDSGRAGQFFLETWGEDVIRIHDVLERYLNFRRSSGMAPCNEFTWLAQEARLIHRSAPTADVQHPIRTVIRHLRS